MRLQGPPGGARPFLISPRNDIPRYSSLVLFQFQWNSEERSELPSKPLSGNAKKLRRIWEPLISSEAASVLVRNMTVTGATLSTEDQRAVF
jgi:hypothetical protein